MHIYKEMDLEKATIHKHHNQRSDLRFDMEKNWLNPDGTSRLKSNIGCQYLTLVDGHLILRNGFERTDILFMQIDFGGHQFINIFIGIDGYAEIQPADDLKIDEHEEFQIKALAQRYYQSEMNYVYREKLFLETEPWKEINGMSVSAGCQKLEQMGW